jgi:ferrochelatase
MSWLESNRAADADSPLSESSTGSSDPSRAVVARHRGVLLINVGTPDAPDVASVRRYLAEFLADPMVIHLPRGLGWFNGPLARLIARFRSPRSSKLYRAIWTDRGSPLQVIMDEQAAALAPQLPGGWQVFVAMRYGRPSIMDVLRKVVEAGVEELVIVPMYPQFSRTTTGTVVHEAYRALREVGQHLNVATRASWYEDVGYINAQAKLIADVATAHGLRPDNARLIFSAHGLPVSYVKRGDPYQRHVERTVELVAARLGWPADRLSLSYQSRLGPAEWLKPNTADLLMDLAANEDQADKKVLVCPIAFTVDCLETLEEIGVGFRASFEAAGGEFHLCPALNTYEPFIAALKNIVLRGCQPMAPKQVDMPPLLKIESNGEPMAEAGGADLKSLIMIGTSQANRVGAGRGPSLRYSRADAFCGIKKTHDEVHRFLQRVKQEGHAEEALVWNTCQRFEFYGWLSNPDDAADRECVIARLRHQLFGAEPDGLNVNVLFGVEAWHHLMRTSAGLNSGLPGDRDVAEQLQTAFRVAEHAGTTGPRAARLVQDAMALQRDIREKTHWRDYSPGYCLAAMSRIRDLTGLDLVESRHVVIGGSTTSCSVIETLTGGFSVSQRQICLAYRSHKGGQIKQLRTAMGNGARLRVQSYAEESVIHAIADADGVEFGIDRNEPVLNAAQIRKARDFSKRPLAVIDFNTFGSTRGLEAIEGVTVWSAARLEHEVRQYAEAMCGDEAFGQAVDEVEEWIERCLPALAAPYLELPCVRNGEANRPKCSSCWRMSEVGAGESISRSQSQCAPPTTT